MGIHLRDIEALTNLILDWQQEHDNTGRWPIGEIAACLGFAAAVLGTLVALIAISDARHWAKWQFALSWLPFALAVIAGGEWLKGKIRKARRVRRRASRKRELLQG